jgi:hypothetical protein
LKVEHLAWRKEMRHDQEKAELRKEVKGLRSERDSMDKMMYRKEKEIEEMKQRGRAGVQTRGSSAAPRSRGVSPAPGMLGGGGKGPSGLSKGFTPDG